jgi:hypothetical protein
MAVDGVVADQDHRVVGGQVPQDESGQGTAEPQIGPGGPGEDPLVIGVVARGQPAERAQEVGDGASALREDRGDEQGVAACWARKSVRFTAPGPSCRRFRPLPNGCSAWRRESGESHAKEREKPGDPITPRRSDGDDFPVHLS